MSGSSTYFRPPCAIMCWTDNVAVYVELPGNPPHVMKFALTEGGLSKALNILRERERLMPLRVTGDHKIDLSPKAQHKKPAYTDNQIAEAGRVLRKLGLIK